LSGVSRDEIKSQRKTLFVRSINKEAQGLQPLGFSHLISSAFDIRFYALTVRCLTGYSRRNHAARGLCNTDTLSAALADRPGRPIARPRLRDRRRSPEWASNRSDGSNIRTRNRHQGMCRGSHPDRTLRNWVHNSRIPAHNRNYCTWNVPTNDFRSIR